MNLTNRLFKQLKTAELIAADYKTNILDIKMLKKAQVQSTYRSLFFYEEYRLSSVVLQKNLHRIVRTELAYNHEMIYAEHFALM